MSEALYSIKLKDVAERLENIKDGIIDGLPESFGKKKIMKNPFPIGNSPKEYEVTTYAILQELTNFIHELKEDAELLKSSALKNKVKV